MKYFNIENLFYTWLFVAYALTILGQETPEAYMSFYWGNWFGMGILLLPISASRFLSWLKAQRLKWELSKRP